jgi:hypothetical protein
MINPNGFFEWYMRGVAVTMGVGSTIGIGMWTGAFIDWFLS